ncbi:MAG: Fic family protein [Raoultibacter sp.]
MLLNLSHEPITIYEKSMGDASRAEISLVRACSNLNASRLRETVAQLSIYLEIASTMGIKDHGQLLTVILDNISFFDKRVIPSYHSFTNKELDGQRYGEALRWATEHVSPKNKLTPEIILDLHSRCLCGKGHHQSGIKFRTEPPPPPRKLSESFSRTLREKKVFTLMSNLCSFINRDAYSPIIQAAMVHAQFGNIQPFELNNNCTISTLYHAVFYRRGLLQKTIVPISLLSSIAPETCKRFVPDPSRQKTSHEEQMGLFNTWISFCAGAVELSANLINSLLICIEALELSWEARIGRFSKNSLLEEILLLLPAHPVITVEMIMVLTGRSFSATNDAVARLVQVGILSLEPVPHQRTRVFRAHEVFDTLELTLKNILPQFLLGASFRTQLLD